RRRQPQPLPVFDNAPGDNALAATGSYPLFVYNGTKGELLVNTMLSAQRYPMQEPVPGQVLRPPATPMFRPKPLVARFRVPKQQRPLLNLTLIPFYAHEAITVAPTTSSSTTSSSTTTTTTTTTLPTPTSTTTGKPTIDSQPVESTPLPRTAYETQLAPSKRRRHPKKTKHYSAYRSPQDVVQRPPVLRASPPRPAPNNHRPVAFDHALLDDEQLEEEEQLLEDTQESAQPESSEPNSLQIVYMDEDSREPAADSLPSSTALPSSSEAQRQSSRYTAKREYFAFPVYTLGKLLQQPGGQRVQMGHLVELGDSSEPGGGDTWFILNSRYKGPHRSGQQQSPGKYYTSKYVQSPKG
ncbi:hypothetical protein KR093_007031, partial [Drosophila rubida]